jgi:hypothetical protein
MRSCYALHLGDIQVYMAAAITLLVGGGIYLLLRQDLIPGVRWLVPDQLWPWVLQLRQITATVRAVAPAWLVFALPDGLWSFSYAAIMARLWMRQTGAAKVFWLLTIPAMGIGSEVGQWLRLIPGYFNATDLIFATLGASLGFWIGYSRHQEITTDKRCSL